MDNFDKSFEHTVGHEGGFTRNRKDRGNWTSGVVGKGALKGTKYGISAMTYPLLDIENLTLEVAKDIYLHDFWAPSGCEGLPIGLDFLVFDAAVNHGRSRSIKFLQGAIGAVPDGVLGPRTMKRVNQRGTFEMIQEFSVRRGMFYAGISTFSTFGLGWMRRLMDTTAEAHVMFQEDTLSTIGALDIPEAPLDQSNTEPANDNYAPASGWSNWFRRT